MGVKKGSAKLQTNLPERTEIVERVCELYESQHATVESCCAAAGIDSRTFRLWVSQNADFAERYKKAKERQRQVYWQDVIRPLAETALQRLLAGQTLKTTTVEDLTFQGSLTNERATTEKEAETAPNPTAVIFALKGLEPEMFADRQKVEQSGSIAVNANFGELTAEQAEKILKTLRGE